MLRTRMASLITGSVVSLSLAAPAAAQGTPCDGNIVDQLQSSRQFEILLAAADSADLVGALQGDGPLTVFAPTDAAFASLPPSILNLLRTSPKLLTEVLLYHVVAGEVFAADVIAGGQVTTLQGETLSLSHDGGGAFINAAEVTFADAKACNGVIHAIDRVLLPSYQNFKEFRLDLVEILELENYTSNEFGTLLQAVVAADLAGALSGPGPLTLFAPRDRAFAKLPEGTLESLLADPAALANILTYHVVPQTLFAADVLSLTGAATLQGSDITFSLDGTVPKVNDAAILATDREAVNGVIHVLDSVLLPPGS